MMVVSVRIRIIHCSHVHYHITLVQLLLLPGANYAGGERTIIATHTRVEHIQVPSMGTFKLMVNAQLIPSIIRTSIIRTLDYPNPSH
jgi:hypothetical protein